LCSIRIRENAGFRLPAFGSRSRLGFGLLAIGSRLLVLGKGRGNGSGASGRLRTANDELKGTKGEQTELTEQLEKSAWQ
jgi:hypothetical protein